MLQFWDQIVARSPSKHIMIVAHSAGGDGTVHLMRSRPDIFQRLRAIAFTDSVHSVSASESPQLKAFMKASCRDYVASTEPLDTPIQPYMDDDDHDSEGCECVSAGHRVHAWTSGVAIASVFTYLQLHLDNAVKKAQQHSSEK